MKISVILPTYNEKENIKKLIPQIFEVLKEKNISGDVIVVDDSSPDKTGEAALFLKKDFPITLLNREKKGGIGSAYVLGFKTALDNKADIIFEMDSDLSHDPKEISNFLEKIDSGYDVVVGSRIISGGSVIGWGKVRKLISWGGNFIGRAIAGVKVSDLTSGYRAYRREVLEEISLGSVESGGYSFQLEMLARAKRKGFRIGTIPIVFHDRTCGDSKLSKRDLLFFFLIALKIRLNLLKK